MADEIRADYRQLEQVAAQFARQANSISQMQQQIMQKMGQLQSAWVGKGSSAFFAEMNDKVLPATARLSSALQEAGKTTRQISQLIAEAERDAAAPFQHDVGGGSGAAGGAAAGGGASGAAGGAASGGAGQDLTSRWAGLSTAERTQALQDVANDVARQHGLQSLPVSVEQIVDPPGQNARGYWDGSRIHIDVDDLNNPDIIKTAAHEARHAVQQSMGDQANPSLWTRLMRWTGIQDTPSWPQYGISEETARAWSENRNNYRVPPATLNTNNPDSVRQMNEYLNQPIEVDARRYADEYVNRMRNR